jgi:hypothetical protein
MFFREHEPPHHHAIYAEHRATVEIERFLEGFPSVL